MDLTFNKVGDVYVAEFEATQGFNLHIEREQLGGFVQVFQNTGGNAGYAIVEDFPQNERYNPVIDYDCTGEVWPKRVKVVSSDAVRAASLTTSGEVTEIKSQSKEIEVTANGIQEVMADAGFAYMDRVTIKTNVPQSGEGGGSASSWRYFDVRKLDDSMKPMTAPFIVKTSDRITAAGLVDWSAVKAVGVDDSPKLFFGDAISSWSEMMATEGLTPEVMAQVGIVEISEDKFYNFDA